MISFKSEMPVFLGERLPSIRTWSPFYHFSSKNLDGHWLALLQHPCLPKHRSFKLLCYSYAHRNSMQSSPIGIKAVYTYQSTLQSIDNVYLKV